jgi:hypothetical protein
MPTVNRVVVTLSPSSIADNVGKLWAKEWGEFQMPTLFEPMPL